MLTNAQLEIIKTVCSHQFKSLESILLEPDLEEDYTLILEAHGCTRKDFDTALINTRKEFQIVWDNPEKLFGLDNLDIEIFKFILMSIQNKFINRYPKALNNLLNKILVYEMTQFIQN